MIAITLNRPRSPTWMKFSSSVCGRDVGWRPPQEAAPTRLRSSPPKRLFGLVDDIAPRKSDVMQVAIGPMRQFTPLSPAFAPHMQPLADLSEKP
jgi:hypothetical protein